MSMRATATLALLLAALLAVAADKSDLVYTSPDLDLIFREATPVGGRGEPFIEVMMYFKNKTETKKLDMTPWAGALKDATVADEFGNEYKKFVTGLRPDGGRFVQEASLNPGKELLAQINAEYPIDKAKTITIKFIPPGEKKPLTYEGRIKGR